MGLLKLGDVRGLGYLGTGVQGRWGAGVLGCKGAEGLDVGVLEFRGVGLLGSWGAWVQGCKGAEG